VDRRTAGTFIFNIVKTRRTELVPGRLYRFSPWNPDYPLPMRGKAVPGDVGKLLGFRECDPNKPRPDDDDAFPEDPIAVLMPEGSDDEDDEYEVATQDLLPA